MSYVQVRHGSAAAARMPVSGEPAAVFLNLQQCSRYRPGPPSATLEASVCCCRSTGEGRRGYHVIGWTGLDYITLDWAGLGWAGFGWTGFD